MDRQGKLYQDEMTVEKYRQQMKAAKMPYMGKAEGRAVNNRRARALTLGECALKIMDQIRECSKGHELINGTLQYMLDEAVVYPIPGVNETQFEYKVMYQVLANEPRYTDEEIQRECEDLTFKLRMETDEMFPEEEGDRGQGSGDKEE